MAGQTLSYQKMRLKNGAVLIVIIVLALFAFEAFNYSTTEFALADLLGGLMFAGIRWSTILSIAFCGIDFAGIARLLVPEAQANQSKEVWYLFAAWLLAATMNAILTWWGVSMAIMNHAPRSTNIIDAVTLTRIVPVFVAVMVLVIRVLIIGTLSAALQRTVEMERFTPIPASSGSNFSSRPPIARPMARPVYTTNEKGEDDESDIATRSMEPVYRPIMAKPVANAERRNDPAAKPGRKL